MQTNKKILLVDEQPLVLAALKELLTLEHDLNICGEAKDGETALNLVGTEKPDMIVLDVSLGKLHGMELIKRVMVKSPNIRILVLSAQDDSLFAPRVLDAGALGYANKRQPLTEIKEAIRTVLSGQVYLGPTFSHVPENGNKNNDRPFVSTIKKLSDRELEIFHLIGKGLTTSQLAEQLRLSVKTIETHKANIKGKLNLKSGNELQVYAINWGLEQF